MFTHNKTQRDSTNNLHDANEIKVIKIRDFIFI